MPLSQNQITKIQLAQTKVNAQIDALSLVTNRANALILIGASVDQPSANTEINTIKGIVQDVITELQLLLV